MGFWQQRSNGSTNTKYARAITARKVAVIAMYISPFD